MNFKKYSVISVIVFISFLFSFCTDSLVIPPEDLNNLPKVKIGFIGTQSVYAPADTLTLHCKPTDQDKDDVLFTIKWISEYGHFIRSEAVNVVGDTTNWIAPAEEGVYNILVSASDGLAEVFDTATVVVQNDPEKPSQPFNPSPENNSFGLGIYQILQWKLLSSSQDIKYDIYFGKDANPGLYDTSIAVLRDTVENLSFNTQYFWRVVAKKDDSTFTSSETWTFTTRSELVGGDASKFEFITINSGNFKSGSKDSIITKKIEYDYQIMKYEVTNKEYKEFLEEVISDTLITVDDNKLYAYYDGNDYINPGSYLLIDLQSEKSKIKYDGSSLSIEAGYENHPVTMVTWFGANLFATYYNCSLPTGDEWEKAARGNTDYNFPWGDEIDSTRANYKYSQNSLNDTQPVGSYNGQSLNGIQTVDSPSQYGCYDMAGNVWEWTLESAAASFYVNGGSWLVNYYEPEYCWQTYAYDAGVTYPYIGFRIVKRN